VSFLTFGTILIDIFEQKGIDENWEAALEHNPEGFARVIMLYVDMEVNGVPLKVEFCNQIITSFHLTICSQFFLVSQCA
jgi:hypothetical protein